MQQEIELEQKPIGKRKIDLDDAANIALFLAIFLGIWQLAYMSGIWPKVSLPSPETVAESFVKLIANSSLLRGIGVTLWRLGIAFTISITIGMVTGLAMVRFRGFGRTVNSFSAGLLAFPSIAWVPFSILLIGFNDFGIMFVVIMSSVFSVMISTYSSIRNVPPLYLRAARNMGAKGPRLFWHVMLPAATPSLIIGIRQAWSFAWHAVIGAEMLMATVGLGHILMAGREFIDMSQVIVSMITVFTMGLLFDRLLLLKLEEKVRRKWGLAQHGE
ncbi:MAG: ABC transporter permease [Nitrososphaerales archaeon]